MYDVVFLFTLQLLTWAGPMIELITSDPPTIAMLVHAVRLPLSVRRAYLGNDQLDTLPMVLLVPIHVL